MRLLFPGIEAEPAGAANRLARAGLTGRHGDLRIAGAPVFPAPAGLAGSGEYARSKLTSLTEARPAAGSRGGAGLLRGGIQCSKTPAVP
jgi:hypothetical protein